MLRTAVKLAFLLLIMLIFSACRPIQAPEPSAALLTPTDSPPGTPPPTITPSAAPTRLPIVAATFTVTVRADEITSKALEDNLLGDPSTRRFYMLLPADYAASDRRYPVLYVLPWGDGIPESNTWGFKAAYEQLRSAGKLPDMIMVFPDGSNSYGASLFRSSPTIGDYESYLVRDLIGYVDANYRTLANRDSRGVAGCSNGGDASLRIALKYPDVFSVAAPSGGLYDESMAKHSILLKELEMLKAIPESPLDVVLNGGQVWRFFVMAAGSVSDPDNPPLYIDVPLRMVDGKAEIVPEVADRIAANDTMRAVDGYLQQPLRLRGILIQHALYDPYMPTDLVRGFDQLLTDRGIKHEYKEFKAGHCEHRWDLQTLEFMAQHLVSEQPAE